MSNKTNCKQTGLRRVDWRFLLPTPDGTFHHLVLLGGTASLAARMLDAGIAQRISLTPPRNHTADAIAKLYNSQAQVADIVESLEPGGMVYFEVDRRVRKQVTLTPRRLLQQLQKVGLFSTGIYWAGPNFEHCKRYIPLDIPEAFRWYFSTLYAAGTPFYSILEIVIRIYTKTNACRFMPLAPCFAVTAKASQPEDTEPPDQAPPLLAHSALPKGLQQTGLRPVLLTSGQDDGSRAVLLPFAPGQNQPLTVLKISTFAGFNASTVLEQTRLDGIRACLDGPMRYTVPRPLGLLRYGNLAVSAESYADGLSLSVSSGRWRVPLKQQLSDLHQATAWLSEFHRQTQVGRELWDDTAIHRWIETPLMRYAGLFGVTLQEECLFTEVYKLANELRGASMVLVQMHYDFGPWNLYRCKGGFTVIDWEFDRKQNRDPCGPSLYDLLYFITYWNYLVHHAYDQEAELNTFYKLFVDPNPEDPYAKAVYTVLAQYTADYQIDQRFVPLMLVYMWVEQAIYQVGRKSALGLMEEENRLNNPRVKHLGVLANHVDLFLNRTFEGLSVT